MDRMCWSRWPKRSIQLFDLFDPVRTQGVCFAYRVRVFSQKKVPGACFALAQERVLILHNFFQGRSIEWQPIDFFHPQLLIVDLLLLEQVLNAILIFHPSELLENTAVAFQNLTVDLRILRCDLAVEV